MQLRRGVVTDDREQLGVRILLGQHTQRVGRVAVPAEVDFVDASIQISGTGTPADSLTARLMNGPTNGVLDLPFGFKILANLPHIGLGGAALAIGLMGRRA